MSQIVEFETLPGARYQQYVFKLRALFGFLGGPTGTEFKKLRDFMRQNGIWDKERSATAMAFLEITWDRKTVTLGPTAKRLLAAASEEDFKEILFKRLKLTNILLVKYVLEALDVDSGGRLHSVNELYRMITSYVYPGEYVTLTNFKAWIEWMAASEVIKMVGIRWALGDPRGTSAVEELKAMDIEEILEDLEEEAEEAEEASTARATASPVASGGDEWDIPDASGTDSDEEATTADDDFGDWADMPPEPMAPSAEQIAAAEAQFTEQFSEEEAPVEQTAPQPVPALAPAIPPVTSPGGMSLHPPLGETHYVIPPSVLETDFEATALAEKIIRWWNELNDWPSYTASDLGVATAPTDEASASHQTPLLIELAALAIIIEGLPPQPQVFQWVNRLRESGTIGHMVNNAPMDEWLDALGSSDDAPWMRPLMGRLVHVREVGKRLHAKPETLERLRQADSGRSALLILRDEIFGQTWVEAPFWMLRELHRLKVVTTDACASVAVVPSERLMKNAASIGLAKRAHAASFDELIYVAQSVATLFGPRAGYGEALEVMDRALGLSS